MSSSSRMSIQFRFLSGPCWKIPGTRILASRAGSPSGGRRSPVSGCAKYVTQIREGGVRGDADDN